MKSRKKIFKILVLILIIPCMMLCSACSLFGQSAYEIAVENGFVGTEQEWLDSLHGTNGKDGKDGKDGTDGVSLTIQDLYDAAVSQGYTGTLLEFINQQIGFSNGSREIAVSKALLSTVKVVASVSNTSTSNGAGVIFSLNSDKSEAFIVTNYHVVYNKRITTSNGISSSIRVCIYGNETVGIPATYIGGSMLYDIAVLKVANSDVLMNSACIAATVVDSDKVVVGQTAIVIGNPEASGISVTAGIVSVDSEYLEMKGPDDSTDCKFRVMRVDAAINSGNSGGGLFDSNGDLIGIVNAKTTEDSSGDTVESMGYALPANTSIRVAELIKELCDGNTNTKLKYVDIDMDVKATSSSAVYDEETQLISIREVVTVTRVGTGSVASAMGITAGRRISKIKITNGRKSLEFEITREYQIHDIMLLVRAGDKLQFFEDNSPFNFKTITSSNYVTLNI